jgi:hypothetical protein
VDTSFSNERRGTAVDQVLGAGETLARQPIARTPAMSRLQPTRHPRPLPPASEAGPAWHLSRDRLSGVDGTFRNPQARMVMPGVPAHLTTGPSLGRHCDPSLTIELGTLRSQGQPVRRQRTSSG